MASKDSTHLEDSMPDVYRISVARKCIGGMNCDGGMEGRRCFETEKDVAGGRRLGRTNLIAKKLLSVAGTREY